MKAARLAVGVVGLGLLVWCARIAAQSLPIDYHHGSSGIPVVHTRDEALAFVKRWMMPYGGMPGDAQLAFSGADSVTMQPTDAFPRGAYAHQDYFFRWQRKGVIAGPDVIIAMVSDAPIRKCLNSSCTHYEMRYVLQMGMLRRTWRPSLIRALTGWWSSKHARMAPQPKHLSANCGHGRLDEPALLRVIGSVNRLDPYGYSGYDPEPRVVEGSALARFAPYADGVGGPPEFLLRGAFVTDARQGAVRGVELYMKLLHPIPPPPHVPKGFHPRKNVYHWVHFDSADDERICAGRTLPIFAPKPATSAPPPDIAADARYRFYNEIEQRTQFRVRMAPNPALAVANMHVRIGWPTGRGTWHGEYSYDDRGELQKADITRP